jgi:hypothetical protein
MDGVIHYGGMPPRHSVVYADCIDIASSIGCICFKYCPRKTNQVVHEIAKFSFLNNHICNWVDEPLALFFFRCLALFLIDS